MARCGRENFTSFRELCSVATNCPLMSLGISYLSHAVCSVATLRPSRKQKSRFLCNFFAIADCLSSLWDRRTADLPCFRAKIHDLESRGNPQSQKRCSPRRFSVFRFPRCFKSGAIGGVDLACLSQLGCGAVGRVDLKQRCWLGRADSVLWVASGMTLRGVPAFR